VILHVVLFRPRADLADADRRAFADAIVRARREIPGIRRFAIGRRVMREVSYAQAMPEDFAYAAIIEFDDLAALQTYLQHPAHDDLGRRFWTTSEAAVAYDYELSDAAGAHTLLA
jgi:sugar-specific transcriptional regulator TrmB